jgi:hypothetical protein
MFKGGAIKLSFFVFIIELLKVSKESFVLNCVMSQSCFSINSLLVNYLVNPNERRL